MTQISFNDVLHVLLTPPLGIIVGLAAGILVAALIGGGLLLFYTGRLLRDVEQHATQTRGEQTRLFAIPSITTGIIGISIGLFLFFALLLENFRLKGTILDFWMFVFIITSISGTLLFLRFLISRTRQQHKELNSRYREPLQHQPARSSPQPKEAREE